MVLLWHHSEEGLQPLKGGKKKFLGGDLNETQNKYIHIFNYSLFYTLKICYVFDMQYIQFEINKKFANLKHFLRILDPIV